MQTTVVALQVRQARKGRSLVGSHGEIYEQGGRANLQLMPLPVEIHYFKPTDWRLDWNFISS